jgi:hypothetical protein
MDKRLVILITVGFILAMIPLASAAGPADNSRTYTKVTGICITPLPHNHLPLKALNAVIVFYTVHEPLHLPKHGVLIMEHVAFTGDFNGFVSHTLIHGEFAGTPILND